MVCVFAVAGSPQPKFLNPETRIIICFPLKFCLKKVVFPKKRIIICFLFGNEIMSVAKFKAFFFNSDYPDLPI
jgi:hypothetical protein